MVYPSPSFSPTPHSRSLLSHNNRPFRKNLNHHTTTPLNSLHLTSPLLITTTLVQAKVQSQHQAQNDDDQENNKQGPPLQLAPVLRGLDALVEVLVGLVEVLHRVVRLLLDRDRLRLGVLDRLGHLLEEEAQLLERGFDALDLDVAGADGAEDRVGGCGAVGFELLCG